jgi:hypothetical protein
VYTTEQVRAVPDPPSVQVVAPKDPVATVDHVTAPVGPTAPAPPVSVTVTVQVDDPPTRSVDGAHETEVLVARGVAVTPTAADPPAWTSLPT